ncbi:glycosyltransferase family 2 protein [Allokutzneria albata]|uniref:Glycosyltransferase involved in cell wall bisynthesis n=1 Tax=Allokutzneria albata TaxID=211114 RepID=A0A1H0CF83_ALLAB|nr:glycosyltransferase [Allokutzneria albata]SDN56558.1 Glycosyltransferase involved in cell wall bisynthesis [Allokutzneria albata]
MEQQASPRPAPSLVGRAAAPIAVALPVYNGLPYIEVALRSLLSQTGVDFELHIADNCSTDGTEELCSELARHDERVVYHRRPRNVGVTANHNRLVEEVDSPYFIWAAADDAYRPDRLAKLYEALRHRPDAVLSFSSATQIDSAGEEIGGWDDVCDTGHPDPVARLRDLMAKQHENYHCYGLFRREVLRRTQLLPPVKNNDRILIAELALYGPFVEVRERLLLHRLHERRLTQCTSQREWYRTQRTDDRKLVLPNVEEAGWYLRAVRRSPLPLVDRARAMLALSPWFRANAVPMARNVAKAALEGAKLAVGGRRRP